MATTTVTRCLGTGQTVPESDVDPITGTAPCPECPRQVHATPCPETDGRDWWIADHSGGET